jgi:hypothetical protein
VSSNLTWALLDYSPIHAGEVVGIGGCFPIHVLSVANPGIVRLAP